MAHIEAYADCPADRRQVETLKPTFDMQSDFFDALSEENIVKAADTFALNGSLLFPGLRPVVGRPLVKRMLGIIRRRYDTIRWRPAGPAIGSGGWLVTSWTVSGTFRNSALPYENEVLSLIQLDADGRIAMLSDYFKDTLAFHPARGPATIADVGAARHS